jgi:hypothetical protein
LGKTPHKVAKSTKFTPATPLSQHNNLSWKHTTFPTSLLCPKWSIRGFTNTKKKKKVRKKKLQKKGKIIGHKYVNDGYRINNSLSHPSTLLSLFGNLM